jgi:hypothetical protein
VSGRLWPESEELREAREDARKAKKELDDAKAQLATLRQEGDE